MDELGHLKFLNLIAFLLLLTGCDFFAETKHWTEEVVLPSGTRIEIERWVKYAYSGDEGSGYRAWPAFYSIKFTNPSTGQKIRWDGGRKDEPIFLDFIGRDSYLVVLLNPIKPIDSSRYGCPSFPYALIKYDENHGKWLPVNDEALKNQDRKSNMSAEYLGRHMEGRKFISAYYVNVVNKDLRAATHYFDIEIPKNYGAWQYTYKSNYKRSNCN